ncbi:MAG: hypothetical protein DCC68_17005 [Planctomycetota bacterium]|nr:MAG: hypothetical protein DCC68_17005 [Planctomycetota bacterium]
MGYLEDLTRIKIAAITALSSDDQLMEELVLKGGNALDLIYGVSARASLDLDYSTSGALESAEFLRSRIETRLAESFAELGLHVFDLSVEEVPPDLSDDVRDFWGGYSVEFKLATLEQRRKFASNVEQLRRRAVSVGKKGSPVFRIDISNHELTTGRLARMVQGYTVYVYSPEMIVCEKIRAICQQMPEYGEIVHRRRPTSPRPRDFLDIYVACQNFAIDFNDQEFRRRIADTFAVKRVPLRLLAKVTDQREFHRQGFVAVRDTVKPDFQLQEFDFYFDFLLARIESLEPLWNEQPPA